LLPASPVIPRACALWLGALAAAWPAPVEAQLPPLAETSAQYLPSSAVPGGGGLKAQVASYDASLNAPFQLGKSSFLIPGAQYHVDSVSYRNQPALFTELNALHSIDLPLLFVQLLSEQWSLSARVWPGLASDFGELDGSALRVGGLVMLAWSPHARLTLGGGPIASYAFGQLLPLPLIYADWKPRPWFRVEASLPAFASLLFTPSDRWELGLQADVSGNEFLVRKRQVRTQYPCRANAVDDPATLANEARADPAQCLDHIAYSVIAGGAVARFRLVSSLWVSGFLGHTLFRRYDLKNAAGSATPDGQVDLPNELALRVGLVFRIPLPEDPMPARP
jgi:hypothetical protein